MKREAQYWLCVGLWLVLAVLLASCASLSPQEDLLTYLREKAELVSEGICTLRNGEQTADFNCRIYQVSENEVNMVIYEDEFRTPVIVFIVHPDGRLSLKWRKEQTDVRPTSSSKVRAMQAAH